MRDLPGSVNDDVDDAEERDRRTRVLFERRIALTDGNPTSRQRAEIERIDAELFDLHHGLIAKQTAKFARYTVESNREDFMSAAKVGLMSAIASYEPDKGSFGGWAYPRVFREVLAAVRLADHANLSRTDFDHRPLVLRTRDTLIAEGVDHPTPEQIAARSGVYIEVVRRVLGAPRSVSLNRQFEGGAELGDLIAAPEGEDAGADGTADPALIDQMRAALDRLSARELAVLCRRRGLDGGKPDSFAALGSVFGMSRESIRKMEQQALQVLQGEVSEHAAV